MFCNYIIFNDINDKICEIQILTNNSLNAELKTDVFRYFIQQNRFNVIK
jgi:hypothetical protein